MPPLPRLRVGVFDELARQLRFAPGEAVRRYLSNAIALSREIDPSALYAEGWLIARITGFRPDEKSSSEIVGQAARADLPALIERFSWAARVSWSELPAGTVGVAGARSALGLDAKAIERARRGGSLIALRVRGPNGRAVLAFTPEAIAGYRPRARRARKRLSEEERGRAVEIARRAARSLGWSRARVARRLAPRFGVAPETIRQLLIANDRGARAPIFGAGGPITPRQRELILRAWRRGIEPGEAARRLGRTVAVVRRELALARAGRLRALELPAWSGRSAGSIDLPRSEPPCVALGLIALARRAGPPRADAERARAGVYRAALERARVGIAGLDRHFPSPTVLDEIETQLRLAARIKVALIESELPLIVRTLDAALGAPLEHAPADRAIELLEASLRAAARAVDGFDPVRGGRLAAPVGLAVQREASRVLRGRTAEQPGRARKATPMLDEQSVFDWGRRSSPWQEWLEPDSRLAGAMSRLEKADRELLAARFGLGTMPRTLSDVARERGWPLPRAAIRERAALRRALKVVRGSPDADVGVPG